MVSRGTKVSARSVVITSFAIFLAYYANDPSKISPSILGVGFTLDQIKNVGIFIVIFLLIGHVISWWGDILSFCEWNVAGKSIVPTMWDKSKTISPLEDSINDIKNVPISASDIKDIMNKYRDNEERLKFCEEEIRRMGKNVSEIQKQLCEIRKGISHLTKFGWITVVGWYFIVPVVMAGLSVFKPEFVVQKFVSFH